MYSGMPVLLRWGRIEVDEDAVLADTDALDATVSSDAGPGILLRVAYRSFADRDRM